MTETENFLALSQESEKKGDFASALEFCDQALDKDPDNANVNAYRGHLLASQGRFDLAEKSFSRAVSLEPGNIAYLNLLGEVCGRRGRIDRAVDAFTRAQAIDPENSRTIANLATAMAVRGEFEQALAGFRKLHEQAPGDLAITQQLAAVYAQLGYQDDASRLLREVLRDHPDDPGTLYNLAANLLNAGQTGEAIEYLNQVINLAPEYMLARLALARALHSLGQIDAAMLHIDHGLRANADDPVLLTEKAALLFAGNRPDEAQSLYERVLQHDQTRIDARCGLAELAIYRNDPQTALDLLGDRIDAGSQPQQVALYARAARLAGAEHGVDTLIDQALASKPISARARSMLLIEKASRHKSRGEIHLAIENLGLAGNGLPMRFDLAAHIEFIDGLKRAYAAPEMADSGEQDQTSVLIVGMPRSGKSLVEQLICSHPDVYGDGESGALAMMASRMSDMCDGVQYPQCAALVSRPQLAALAKDYLAGLRRHAGGAKRITRTLPVNFYHVGLARQLLPRTRIIHCRRDRSDLLLACYEKDFLDPEFDFSNTPETLLAYFDSYRDVIDYWRENTALEWCDVDYENLVTDTGQVARRLVEFAGLEWHQSVLDYYRPDVPNTRRQDLVGIPFDDREIGQGRPYQDWFDARSGQRGI